MQLPLLLLTTVYDGGMVKRPKNLSVAHMDYRIKWPRWILRVKGDCDNNKQRIRVCSSMSLKTQQHVIFHEMLHAIWYSYGITLPSEDDDYESEEDLVNRLSGPIMETLHRNPEFTEFITAPVD